MLDVGNLEWLGQFCLVFADFSDPHAHAPLSLYDFEAKLAYPVIAAFIIRPHAYRAIAALRNVACLANPAIATKRAAWQRPHLAQ